MRECSEQDRSEQTVDPDLVGLTFPSRLVAAHDFPETRERSAIGGLPDFEQLDPEFPEAGDKLMQALLVDLVSEQDSLGADLLTGGAIETGQHARTERALNVDLVRRLSHCPPPDQALDPVALSGNYCSDSG